MKRAWLIGILVLLCTTAVFAQFGLPKGGSRSDSPSVNVDDLLSQGGDMAGYLTLATDQGMKAMDLMMTVFPPEKIAKYQEMSKKYNEAKGSRKDGNIDADQYKLAGEAGAEFAKLDADWKGYQKDKIAVIPKANSRLGLMLLADAEAAIRVPGVLKSLQDGLNSIGSNPMNASKVTAIKGFITLLTAASTQLPRQVESGKTVRGIAKKIAEAEKMKLGDDPAPDKVKDKASLQSSVSELKD